MKNDLAKILLLVFLLIGCKSWGGDPQDKKPDPMDTLQKPLPDSILVRDTSIKALSYAGDAHLKWGYDTMIICYPSGVWYKELQEIRKRKTGEQ